MNCNRELFNVQLSIYKKKKNKEQLVQKTSFLMNDRMTSVTCVVVVDEVV